MENNIPPSFIFPSIILYSGRRSLFGERKGHLLSNCYLIWLAWIKLKINIPWVNIPFHGGTDVQALASCWGQGIEPPSGELGVSLGMGWDGKGADAGQQRHTMAETLDHVTSRNRRCLWLLCCSWGICGSCPLSINIVCGFIGISFPSASILQF